MSPDDRARRRLERLLVGSLGDEATRALMDELWRRDPADFETRMLARFDQVDARFADIDRRFDQLDLRFEASEQRLRASFFEEMNRQTRLLFFGMVGAMFTSASLAFAAVRFG
jgi:hypothetical protein